MSEPQAAMYQRGSYFQHNKKWATNCRTLRHWVFYEAAEAKGPKAGGGLAIVSVSAFGGLGGPLVEMNHLPRLTCLI